MDQKKTLAFVILKQKKKKADKEDEDEDEEEEFVHLYARTQPCPGPSLAQLQLGVFLPSQDQRRRLRHTKDSGCEESSELIVRLNVS